MNRQILGICGYARVGKTTTCAALLSQISDSVIVPFADPVKQIASECFGWDGVKDERGRRLLQLIGTEVGRSYNPNIWVDKWRLKVEKLLANNLTVLVDDVRFQNEIDCIHDMGGVVFRMRCLEREYKYDHPSEMPTDLKVDLNLSFSEVDTPEYVAQRMLYAWRDPKNT